MEGMGMDRDKLLGVGLLIEEVDLLQTWAAEQAKKDAAQVRRQRKFLTQLEYERSSADPPYYLSVPERIIKELVVDRQAKLVAKLREAGFQPGEDMVMSRAEMLDLLGCE
jgi:hypothetical protein